MNIDLLENREDLDSVYANLDKIGWKYDDNGNNLIVFLGDRNRIVLVSSVIYKFCGIWLRPVYARLDLKTYIDIETFSSALLRIAFSEFGSISLLNVDKESSDLTITYRIFIPASANYTDFMSGILAANISMGDIKRWVERIHQR